MRVSLRLHLLLLLVFFAPVYADSHHPQDFLKSIEGSKTEGEQIYSHFCANCHAKKPLIELGAPKIGEETDWKLRLNQDINILYKHSDEGLNGMPPRGGCFECTDEQLILAIVEMVPKKNKKDVLNKLRAHKKSS